MKFSVLISIYLRENPVYLKAAVDSIFNNQEVKPNEVVIVKDGPISLDLELACYDLQRKYPEVVLVGYEQNRGLGFALQFGLERCTYNIIARMDADDLCVKNRFKIQLHHLMKNDLDVCGMIIEEFDSVPGDLGMRRTVPINPGRNYWLRRNAMNHMTVMFKRDTIEKVGGYQEMPGYEDYFLWLRLWNAGYSLSNIQEIGVYARIGNGMINRRKGHLMAMRELIFQYNLLKIGISSPVVFFRNAFLRVLPRYLPTGFLKLGYKFLRK